MPTPEPFKIAGPGSWKRIPLHLFGNVVATALVDTTDYTSVSTFHWYMGAQGYPTATIGRRRVTLHRFLFGEPKGKQIDHKNHNKLDNRRRNLRACEPWQNAQNATGAGVSFYKARGRWRAKISWRGETITIGTYVNEADAKRARAGFLKLTRVRIFDVLEEIHQTAEGMKHG